ncbi:MAG: hypothetical protein GX660_17940 [Clostridiaceae bacterium]|nr:hypothetical protein [Clostridiaceae bacterium]
MGSYSMVMENSPTIHQQHTRTIFYVGTVRAASMDCTFRRHVFRNNFEESGVAMTKKLIIAICAIFMSMSLLGTRANAQSRYTLENLISNGQFIGDYNPEHIYYSKNDNGNMIGPPLIAFKLITNGDFSEEYDSWIVVNGQLSSGRLFLDSSVSIANAKQMFNFIKNEKYYYYLNLDYTTKGTAADYGFWFLGSISQNIVNFPTLSLGNQVVSGIIAPTANKNALYFNSVKGAQFYIDNVEMFNISTLESAGLFSGMSDEQIKLQMDLWINQGLSNPNIVIDLTATFGAGNEPSLEDFETYYLPDIGYFEKYEGLKMHVADDELLPALIGISKPIITLLTLGTYNIDITEIDDINSIDVIATMIIGIIVLSATLILATFTYNIVRRRP